MLFHERDLRQFWQKLWGVKKPQEHFPEEVLHFATMDFPEAGISRLISDLQMHGDHVDKLAAGALDVRFHQILDRANNGLFYSPGKSGYYVRRTDGITLEEAREKSDRIRPLVYEQAMNGNVGVLAKLSTLRRVDLWRERSSKEAELKALYAINKKNEDMIASAQKLKRKISILDNDCEGLSYIEDGLYERIDRTDLASGDPWQIFLTDPRYTRRVPSVFVTGLAHLNLDPQKN